MCRFTATGSRISNSGTLCRASKRISTLAVDTRSAAPVRIAPSGVHGEVPADEPEQWE